MEIQLHGRLVTCTPEEYKRLIELNLIEIPIVQSSNNNYCPMCSRKLTEVK